MAPGVLPQVIFSVERPATFNTSVSLLACVHHLVECKLFLAFECFTTHGARKRPLGTMALPVSCQMVLTLQSCATDVAHKPPLRCVTAEVLLQQMFVQILGLTLRTPEHGRPVRAVGYPYLTGPRLEPRSWRCGTLVAIGGRRYRLFAIIRLFPPLGLRLRLVLGPISRVLQEMVQGERGRQMGQIIGYCGPGRGNALPRRRHGVGGSGARLPVTRVMAVVVGAVQTSKILVHLKRARSEMGANHGEVHLLEYVTRTERWCHGIYRYNTMYGRLYLQALVILGKSRFTPTTEC